jgi:hypothetical protein
MFNTNFISRYSSWGLLTSAALLGLALAAGPVASADSIDPDADKILRSMSTYLGGLSAFRAKADVDSEIVDLQGQKLQLSSSAAIVAERPGKIHVRRQGMLADVELVFDGKLLTLYERNRNAYFQVEVSGTIDDAFDALRADIDLDVPGVDLLYADSYPALISGVNSSAYLGTAYVGGVKCHHLTFREDKVDWQLWVKAGDEPLPMKYIITTKWITGAPQYSIRYRDWNTKPQVDANNFKFSVSQGAKKLDSISVDKVGEPVIGEGK